MTWVHTRLGRARDDLPPALVLAPAVTFPAPVTLPVPTVPLPVTPFTCEVFFIKAGGFAVAGLEMAADDLVGGLAAGMVDISVWFS